MSISAKWTQIASSVGARSSLASAIVDNHLYTFGGELLPRIPLPPSLFIQDLNSLKTEVLNSDNQSWPPARVGTSMSSHGTNLYVVGGRGGKEMTTFGEEEDLWNFDTIKRVWTSLKTTGDKPVQRSFHTTTVIDDTLFLHAGCPVKGRLATLHSLNLSTLEWTELESAPGPGRGGTVLCALPASGILLRFAGFGGIELEGLETYDVETGKWTEQKVEGPSPEKRSVHGLLPYNGPIKSIVAILIHGEREGAPAELGHDGAGFFHSDVWALSFSDSLYSWKKLELTADSAIPEARGWFASNVFGNKIIMQGGLNEKNERLDNAFILEIV